MRYTRFPSPRPSPQGRGRMVLRLSITPVPEFGQQPSAKHPSDACCSLSLRERVRVRGKYSVEHAECSISLGLLSKSGCLRRDLLAAFKGLLLLSIDPMQRKIKLSARRGKCGMRFDPATEPGLAFVHLIP